MRQRGQHESADVESRSTAGKTAQRKGGKIGMTTKTYQLPPRDWEDGYLAGMEDALHLLSSMGVASETIAALREKAKFKLPERKPKHIGYYGEILDRPGDPPYSLLPDFAKRQDIDLNMEGQLMYRWHRHVGVVGEIANDLDEKDIAARLEELQDYDSAACPRGTAPCSQTPKPCWEPSRSNSSSRRGSKATPPPCCGHGCAFLARKPSTPPG